MNYSKLVKIIPLLDSSNDAEALAALRAVARALAPETFGDVARLIETSLEVEAPVVEAKPFTGFKTAAKGPKPAKPLGEGWFWRERNWNWALKPKPEVSRFETLKWADPEWEIVIDFPKVLDAALQVMAIKLSRNDKALANSCAARAVEDKPISTYELICLEQLERLYVNV